MKQTFLILYRPGTARVQGKGFAEQNLLAHGNYMNSLYQQEILIEGGPFTDNSGGMALISVENEDQAKEIIAKDPAVIEKVFAATLSPWMRVDWANF